MPKRGRYEIHDRAKREAIDLARFNHMNPRYLIVDRFTGKTVDEVDTQYEARQARRNWNAGVHQEGETVKYTMFNEVRKDDKIRTGMGEEYEVLEPPAYPGGGLVVLQTDRGEVKKDGREEVFILNPGTAQRSE